MGEIGLGRHLRVAAAVSLAALAAACAGNRHEAPVIIKGAAPDQVEAAPIRRRGSADVAQNCRRRRPGRVNGSSCGRGSRSDIWRGIRRHEAGDHRGQQFDPAGIQNRDRKELTIPGGH